MLTVAELRDALKMGDSAEETAEATRLLAVASDIVIMYHNVSTQPADEDTIRDQATVMLCGYLLDRPLASPGASYADAFTNSGARGLLNQTRPIYAGVVELNDAG